MEYYLETEFKVTLTEPASQPTMLGLPNWFMAQPVEGGGQFSGGGGGGGC